MIIDDRGRAAPQNVKYLHYAIAQTSTQVPVAYNPVFFSRRVLPFYLRNYCTLGHLFALRTIDGDRGPQLRRLKRIQFRSGNLISPCWMASIPSNMNALHGHKWSSRRRRDGRCLCSILLPSFIIQRSRVWALFSAQRTFGVEKVQERGAYFDNWKDERTGLDASCW